ncbi:MAG TPA: DUF3299 domain-containing protein [bacterium]|nr:DUF3299 domain-containing protein [bacterium]
MLRRSLTLLCLTALASEPEPVGFAVLAGFDYTEGMTLPKEVTALDEKVVEIRGFMKREAPGSGPVDMFMLINDACGCNGTPKMNEIVFCTLPEGESTDIKMGVVKVTGKLYVGEVKEDGVVIMIYEMDADTITTTTTTTAP